MQDVESICYAYKWTRDEALSLEVDEFRGWARAAEARNSRGL